MILVNVSDEDQHQRLKDRKYDEKQIQRRISSQYDEQKKLDIINEERKIHNHGSIHQTNSSGGLNMASILEDVGYCLHDMFPKNWFL